GHGLYRVTARYGFMEPPDVPAAIAAARRYGLTARDDDTTYYLAHLTLLASDRIGMAAWRDKLFIVLARNARRATNFFRIPAHQAPASLHVDRKIGDVVVRLARVELIQAGPPHDDAVDVGDDDGMAAVAPGEPLPPLFGRAERAFERGHAIHDPLVVDRADRV